MSMTKNSLRIVFAYALLLPCACDKEGTRSPTVAPHAQFRYPRTDMREYARSLPFGFFELKTGSPDSPENAAILDKMAPPVADVGSGFANYEYRLCPYGIAYLTACGDGSLVDILLVWSTSARSNLLMPRDEQAPSTYDDKEKAAEAGLVMSGRLDPDLIAQIAPGTAKHDVATTIGVPISPAAERSQVWSVLLVPRGVGTVFFDSEGIVDSVDVLWWREKNNSSRRAVPEPVQNVDRPPIRSEGAVNE